MISCTYTIVSSRHSLASCMALISLDAQCSTVEIRRAQKFWQTNFLIIHFSIWSNLLSFDMELMKHEKLNGKNCPSWVHHMQQALIEKVWNCVWEDDPTSAMELDNQIDQIKGYMQQGIVYVYSHLQGWYFVLIYVDQGPCGCMGWGEQTLWL